MTASPQGTAVISPETQSQTKSKIKVQKYNNEKGQNTTKTNN